MKKLLLQNLMAKKIAISCTGKDEWYQVLYIMGIRDQQVTKEWNFDMNPIPGLTKNTVCFWRVEGAGPYLPARNLKSVLEDNGYEIASGHDFIAANKPDNGNNHVAEVNFKEEPAVEKPVDEEKQPATKFTAGHQYIVRTYDTTNKNYVKLTILEVTKTCYNYKFENSVTNTWDTISSFENSFDLVEDITPENIRLTEVEKAVLLGTIVFFKMSGINYNLDAFKKAFNINKKTP